MTETQKQETKEQQPTLESQEKAPKDPKKELQDMTATLQRLQADFENYKKRTEKEKALATQQATTKIIQQLLPIIDTFELALKNKSNQEQFTKGIEMIYAQLYHTLQNLGLKPINTTNKKFDPHLHEVLMQEERKECEDDAIVEEFQKGYILKDNVIRTSKVKITKKVQIANHDKQNNTAQHH